ncbi:hypothetical protein L249_3248 [Ophiocordyceps polyrhachis-furcata BCC 54312]|uniref:Uncharacterized protein n=1 Tax=Ophiocordyceps polyrhachis-furcata BCC 54312 TaxID=1330021 RepID=A0A367LPL8_9HYPO|nr:hypothetical protein L249_3248 [Ophiocordyceps polyrhachis-furcata BCC 54312]
MGPPLITGGSFDILQDEACPRRQFPPAARDDPLHALREIITLQEHNFFVEPAAASDTTKQQRLLLPRRSARHRRPPVECETFEPLDAVIEEPDQETSVVEDDQGPARTLASLGQQQNPNVSEQVAKHLAGRFKWLMMYPAQTGDDGPSDQSRKMVYGCNFLRRKPAHQGSSGSRDSYCFVATPLKDVGLDDACQRVASATAQPLQYPGQPIKAVDLVKLVEKALSPPLVDLSDDDEGTSGSSFHGPVSVSRIEDSFEELDKLEDELEAVKAAALPRPIPSPSDKAFTPSPTTPCKRRTSCTIGRDAQPLTVRIKPREKTKPNARRAASLTLRADQGNGAADKAKAPPTTPKAAPKSLKPLTIPRFELPGDAVARRLREQRLARVAQQAEAQQKAQTCSPKPKAAAGRRPLTKPTFELPGEAISRRKREEREAKLRAEEEEDRKKREFKARPVRQGNGGGHATLPRATATTATTTTMTTTTTATTGSRLRRSQEETETAGDKTKVPRSTAGAAVGGSKSLPGRVRRVSGSAPQGRRKAER